MSKSERRDLIKSIYPKACNGDSIAISALKKIMLREKVTCKCIVCGRIMRSTMPTIARCSLHDMRRPYMRKSISQQSEVSRINN